MAKRLSDTDKWKDDWFFNLSNDNKLIWIYLLDHCDYAGIFKLNIRQINFNCSTNITVEDFFTIFANRVTQIGNDTVYINRFCEFQYGSKFLSSKNAVTLKAIGILKENGLVQEKFGMNVLTLPSTLPSTLPPTL